MEGKGTLLGDLCGRMPPTGSVGNTIQNSNRSNQCLLTGRFPAVWKRADLVILRKGEDRDPEQLKSYRPVCLLNNMRKVLERLICKS